ncbi:Glyoxylate reductase 1 [Candida viswanathii]|uniref:Glyoxylate reductase 1 n=1 Tax=Candida viswanathii TaxID=5486 RepID=A0A367Y7L9_9ASCO|nr:Glyoxylate reductase 1 [Candida viswanathii]
MTTKPRAKVLRTSPFSLSESKWNELRKIADVIDCESTNRDEFIRDLQTKYADITNIARDFDSLAITGRLDAEIAKHVPSTLKTISHCGAGYDQIDVAPFTEIGVQVSNVTDPVAGPTADTAVFLVLGAMRRFVDGHKALIAGQWPKAAAEGRNVIDMAHSPQGKTLAILGMGGIGRAIRDRLTPFGFDKIIYYNRNRLSPELEKNAQYVSLDELYRTADVIVIGIPLNANTRHMINKESIGKMKDGVVLVNIARGAIIDEAVLPEMIKSGKIGAFGSDVFEHEPEVSPELYNLPNVVSLPHLGTHSIEASRNMEEWVVENIESFIKTGKVKTIVPEQKGLF